MQVTVVNIVILGLLVSLFAVITRGRSDDRLRCWGAGWFCVLGHFAAELGHPSTVLWQNVQASVNVGALALAGIFFVVSTVILEEGRRVGIRLWIVVALTTIACFSLVTFDIASVWLLSSAVVLRQVAAILMVGKVWSHRPLFASILTLVCLTAGSWGLYGVFHGHPELVIVALLSEIFLVAAIDFWSNGWERTLALHTMAVGLAAWGSVFPLGYLTQYLWPHLVINGEVWNMPKYCVAAGMILMVLEEDARAARKLGDEYRLVFDGNPHPLWIFETDTLQFVAANHAALNLHGYTQDEFLQLKLTDILDPAAVSSAKKQAEAPEPVPNRASRHLRKDGTPLPMDITAHNIVFQGKHCRFVLGLDVTERDALEQQLIRQSQHDALTGLPNRMLFEDRLTEAVETAVNTGEKLAILCLDICRFKRINDVFGPRTGDDCIRHVASVLNSCARATDIVARTGGDEFAVVLTGVRNAAAAEQIAAELRERFREPVFIHGYNIELSFSMGLAICPDDGTDAIALWRGAESVLRRAQTEGGGQTIWLSPELREDAEEQIEIESSMRMRMEDAGFHVAFQPLYGFDGHIHGLEALLRLDHVRYGAVSPMKIIPIAEETGLIVPLGHWVMEQVCRQMRAWMDDGMRTVPVAINVSALQLMHVDFAERLMVTLGRYSIDPHWIHLEVTETAAMRNLKEVSGQMDALSALGISFSIDDFGTGHSSLGRLHQLPISVLKIDRSFIEQLCVPNQLCTTLTIVQAILSMAHALGQQVVAEGVETGAQLACLRELDCDLLQGFLLSRPVSPKEIPALMATAHPAFAQAASAHRDAGLRPEEAALKAR